MSAIKTIKKYARLMGIKEDMIGYIMLKNFAKEIADDIKGSRPTVRKYAILKEANILRKEHPSKDCRFFAESVFRELSKAAGKK